MRYFYDHQTDSVSLQFTDFVDYASTEELAPGVVMYVDKRKRALAVDLRNASKVMDTNGLMPMLEGSITGAELSQRLDKSPIGQSVLKILARRSDAMLAAR